MLYLYILQLPHFCVCYSGILSSSDLLNLEKFLKWRLIIMHCIVNNNQNTALIRFMDNIGTTQVAPKQSIYATLFKILCEGYQFTYRLITACLLLRVNLDKIMHARWDFDVSSARTRRVSALDKHQNWSASVLFCLNSGAQSKYAVVNLIHTRRKQTFLSFIMW